MRPVAMTEDSSGLTCSIVHLLYSPTTKTLQSRRERTPAFLLLTFVVAKAHSSRVLRIVLFNPYNDFTMGFFYFTIFVL